MNNHTNDISFEAEQIIEKAEIIRRQFNHKYMGLYHFLLALIENYPPLLDKIDGWLDPASVVFELHVGHVGRIMDIPALIDEACRIAAFSGQSIIREEELSQVVLYRIQQDTEDLNELQVKERSTNFKHGEYVLVSTDSADKNELCIPSFMSNLLKNIIPPIVQTNSLPNGAMPLYGEEILYSSARFPIISGIARNLTMMAVNNQLPPLCGREEELQLVMETLCRRTKRNPVLVGPAGVGKTSIVEGLAQLIAHRQVPTILQGQLIFALQPSLLIAHGNIDGTLHMILEEISNQPVILFIDELHTIIGKGSDGSGDISNILKPALSRGDIACIGATTDDEYRRFIEDDHALERRFQPIRIQEMTPGQTMQVLVSLRDDLQRLRGVRLPESVCKWAVNFAEDNMHNRHFPDKAVDLLDQAAAYALVHGKTDVEQDIVEKVAQRMIGMPVNTSAQIEELKRELAELGFDIPNFVNPLGDRLKLTMHGLDFNPTRSNAVILLTGNAVSSLDILVDTLAATLYGNPAHKTIIDMGRFTHHSDMTLLIGAPPGYIGHNENLPIHALQQMPLSVLCLKNIDLCHPQITLYIAQALADGYITDSHGRKIYLCDAVVVLTASGINRAVSIEPLGFRSNSAYKDNSNSNIDLVDLEPSLLSQIHFILYGNQTGRNQHFKALYNRLLKRTAILFKDKYDLSLTWKPNLLTELKDRAEAAKSIQEVEGWLESAVLSKILKYVEMAETPPKQLYVDYEDNMVCLREHDIN